MNAFGLPRNAVAGPYLAPVNFQGATALHLAAFYGHSGVTDLLLAAGACDVTACTFQVCSAITAAIAVFNLHSSGPRVAALTCLTMFRFTVPACVGCFTTLKLCIL